MTALVPIHCQERRCAADSPRSGARALATALALAVVAGCATPATPYRAARDAEDQGYREQRIEANRYRVSFTGNSATSREAVENFMLLRTAELTLAQGYDYFVLDDSDTERQTYYLQSTSAYGPLDPFYGCMWPRSGFALSSATPITNYKAQAYVVMFKGGKPPLELKAFDARDVQRSLAPQVRGTPGGSVP